MRRTEIQLRGLNGFKDFRTENGSSQGQNLDLTGLFVPSSLDVLHDLARPSPLSSELGTYKAVLSPTTNQDIHFIPRLELIVVLKTNNFDVSNQKWSQFQGDNQLATWKKVNIFIRSRRSSHGQILALT